MAVGVNEALRRIEEATTSGETSLDLSDLRLTELPPQLAELTGLTNLRLGGNRFTVLPAWLGGLTNLTLLNLGSCRLDTVPAWVRDLTKLTELYLDDNRLTELPDWLATTTNLTRLDLDDNRFAGLPDWLGELTGITTLDIGGCRLGSVPVWLRRLTNLTELWLNENRLTELPTWLGDLTEITKLRLHNNRFTELPETLGNLTGLTTLNLRNCQLAAAPDWLANLTGLTTLDMSSNRLTELPDWFGNLTRLTTVRLQHNRFGEVPPQLAGLTGLRELRLSGNWLTELPDWLGTLTDLTTLWISACRLRAVPEWLSNLTGLVELRLGSNLLTELPDWVGDLTGLKRLHLQGNELTELPNSMANLTGLTVLWVGENELASVPESLAGLTGLTDLRLEANQLTALPDWLGKLTGLTSINLGGCELTTVPRWLAELSQLTSLRLDDNSLTELPEWLASLSGLTTLSLNGNSLTTLPEQLANLTELSILNLNGCQLTTLPQWVASLTELNTLNLIGCGLTEVPQWLRDLPNLSTLRLNNNRLAELPECISDLTNLITLLINKNNLTALPDSITKLPALKMLWLDENPWTTLPDWLGECSSLTSLSLARCELSSVPQWVNNLTNLEDLYLERNSLTELPEWISDLPNLTILWLYGNRLSALPDSITELTGLNSIRLDDNRLTTLPPDIGALTGLAELRLENNRLTSLPDSIANLTRLTELNANNNQLTSLPSWLTEMPNLTDISVSENPLVSPPPEIAAAGSESLMAFIQARKQGSSAQWLSKLLVVGEGGVGKTSLVRALADEEHNPEEKSTHGLMIKDLTVQHPGQANLKMRLNAWDFGGQQIYHATHQFFLTNRSLFLLLWNSRLGWEQGKLRYWLDIITARAPESPIVLVATHITDRPVDLPLYELKQEYPKIVDSVSIDNATREGIDALRARLAKEAAELPLMGSEWPTSWLAAADAVRGASENHVTPGRMWELMAGAGVTDQDQQRYLAVALHELGDILYYSDDPELAQTVVLRPEWVNDYISMVLDSERVAGAHGLLTRRHLNELWADLDRGLRDHFLGMMDKYDLSYRIEGGQADDLSLVVERLQWNPPDFQPEWDEIGERANTREIRVLYRLNTMPPGIPTWFIARAHRFSKERHWRSGALLGHGDGQHLALVRADRHRNIVELAVRGPAPASFFSILDDGLNLTLQRFPGLQITRQVPCRCGSGCPELFDYDDLYARLARTPPRDQIECRKSGEDVSVPQLLLGLAPPERDAVRMSNEQILAALARIEEQGEYAQRAYLKTQRMVQAQQEARCPSVFAIVPTGKKVTGSAYELRLYCEQPGAWHRLPEPAGCYPIAQPAEWLRKVGPYLRYLLAGLKHVTPLAGPVLGIAVDQLDTQVKADCDLMKELVSQLPDEVRHKTELAKGGEDAGPAVRAVNEADFRALQGMLNKLDPDQAWGGLSRTVTPEGLTLYLCADHVAAYRQPAVG